LPSQSASLGPATDCQPRATRYFYGGHCFSRTKAWSADREIRKSSVSVPAPVAGVGRGVIVTAVDRADDTVEDHMKVSAHIGDDAYLVQGGVMIQTP
jgi:hypothetical protein